MHRTRPPRQREQRRIAPSVTTPGRTLPLPWIPVAVLLLAVFPAPGGPHGSLTIAQSVLPHLVVGETVGHTREASLPTASPPPQRWRVGDAGKLAGMAVAGVNILALFFWVMFRQRRHPPGQ